MAKFLKKPVIVDAVQFSPYRTQEMPEGVIWDTYRGAWMCVTAHGAVQIKSGDWIVTAPDGDRWPVKEAIFEETYERIPDDPEEL